MTSVLLIADRDAARGRALSEACALRGFASRTVTNGAEALDVALTEVPDVLVATGELDLIPFPKLAEILRANPRTQGMRLLLIGEPSAAADVESWIDESLEPSTAPDEVARSIESLLERSARLDAVERQAEADQEVHGRLTQIPLTDLLQLFNLNRRTGTIALRRRAADGRDERGRVHVRDGEVVQAVAGTVEAEKALFRLLAWSDGAFSFRSEPIALGCRMRTPTRALLMEAARQHDEWRELGPKLPPLDAEVTLKVARTELPNVVHPVSQEVLLLLEIYTRVRDVVDHCSCPDYQVLRTLQTLSERGIVEVRKGPGTPAREAGLLSRAQVRRMREWLAPSSREPAPLRDPKLLLFSSDAAGTQELLRLLATLPGASVELRFAERRLHPHDLGRVGRLRVDPQLAIELIHVPSDPAFAPVWPLAAHGALGAVLLVAGNPAQAARELAPAVELLRSLPRIRLIPLLLGRPGETALPDEVRESLALFEDASPVFLSLADRAEGLRSVLARLVP